MDISMDLSWSVSLESLRLFVSKMNPRNMVFSEDYSKNNLHLYHFIYNHNLTWLWFFMDILCSSSSEAEVIPERIKKFLTVLGNPSGIPNIRVRMIAQERVVYSIPNPEWGIPICVNTDELAPFLFPDNHEASIAHRDALVQKTFETCGYILAWVQKAAIDENDTNMHSWCARLRAACSRIIQDLTTIP